MRAIFAADATRQQRCWDARAPEATAAISRLRCLPVTPQAWQLALWMSFFRKFRLPRLEMPRGFGLPPVAA